MSCIVVVDDQGTSRRVMSKLASTIEADAAIVEFGDPLDALSFFRDNTPDLVITDYSMPVIDGAEFVRRFRGMPECYDVPVVVVTSYTNPEFRRLALEAGTTDYLSLPLDFEEFRLRSRNLIALRHARRFAGAHLANLPLEEVGAGEIEHDQARTNLLDGLVQTLSRRLIDKIKELDVVRGDLAALLDISPCAAVFVDEDLRICRFTTAAAALFGLTDRDIGQNIPCASGQLGRIDLTGDLTIAKERNRVVERFIEEPRTGRFYQIRIIPNRYKDDAIWGAVISVDRIHVGAPGFA